MEVTNWLWLNFLQGSLHDLIGRSLDPLPCGLGLLHVLVLHSPRLDPIRLSYTWNLNSPGQCLVISHCPTQVSSSGRSQYGQSTVPMGCRWSAVSWTWTCLCVYCVLCQGSFCTCDCTSEVCIQLWHLCRWHAPVVASLSLPMWTRVQPDLGPGYTSL